MNVQLSVIMIFTFAATNTPQITITGTMSRDKKTKQFHAVWLSTTRNDR